MSIKIGIVMDPIQAISYKKDTSLAMLVAAQKRGWSLFYMEQGDLYLQGDAAMAEMRPLKVAYDPNDWYALGDAVQQPLAELDVILMRKDPPFDSNFIYSTYLLERAEQAGTLIVNKPQSLRDCNEKVFATQFPQCCPPLLVSSKASLLKAFHKEHGDVIFKPLDGMGGSSIFRLQAGDPNFSVIAETLTAGGKNPIMAQRYLPEIINGDKRILLIDGDPVPYALARVPAIGETRGNLAAGGSGRAQPLSDRDRWICEQVRDSVREKGLLFVGLDVIGDYLTEINVTSPTCVREIDRAYDLNIADDLMQVIENKLQTSN
ncbi:glutathione synthetase [Pseudohongiella nitratireducens]|uniref:Glutathione synthetase n=1 Tax=Pseudohongiella nitratireducens TaxID=1768907 RepID=A0A917GL72_9GAMM|nr:glutathione synthase [Pseudohongiella nitratireducens]GGG50465.1 glutathione synthetase [Pseudohongiella nitratireducens]|tara:strand:- start:3141 stop:4097 length:957 start_codon:yes stop_codon:yes gene_type:complete